MYTLKSCVVEKKKKNSQSQGDVQGDILPQTGLAVKLLTNVTNCLALQTSVTRVMRFCDINEMKERFAQHFFFSHGFHRWPRKPLGCFSQLSHVLTDETLKDSRR